MHQMDDIEPNRKPPQIGRLFDPGTIGAIVAMHGQHYADNWGFGTVFEAKVAVEIAEFALRRSDSDLVLIATDEMGVCGSLILDLNDPTSGTRGAHLRWFITAERSRGTGLGNELLERAVSYAQRTCAGRIWLTTFRGLNAARHLYEKHGFVLVHEQVGEAWGTRVSEQEFRR